MIEDDEYDQMSVKELMKLLNDRRVDSIPFLEKSELVAAVRQLEKRN